MKHPSIHDILIALLQNGLWRRELDFSVFPQTKSVWEELFQLSRKHTVEGIVYDGVLSLPEPFFPPADILMRWTVAVDRIEKANEHMNQTIADLQKMFGESGMNFLLLKGQGVAGCYENPLHRVCGDIDLCFLSREGQIKANKFIEGQGIELYAPEFSANYVWKGCEVEHHGHLINIYNPFKAKFIQEFEKKEFQNNLIVEIEGQKVTLPSPVLTSILSNTHILKHQLGFGIGLRQVCDSARIYYHYHDRLDGSLLKSFYKKIGIYRWVQTFHAMLVKVGLDESYLPFPLDARFSGDEMLNNVLFAGNFGFHDERFGTPDVQLGTDRGHMAKRLAKTVMENIRLAPAEVVWFPFMKIYTRFKQLIRK